MARFPEAQARLFKNKFACKKCKKVLKGNIMSIMAGKVKCKRCGGSALRPLRKK